MIQTQRKSALGAFLVLTLLLASFLTFAQSATYQLDIKQSKLFWKGTKTIGTKHYGYLLFNLGWLRTNVAGKLSDGMFNINMKSIKSTEHKDNAKNNGIEKELNGSAFFETSKYPASLISIHTIMPTPVSSQYRVDGDLTIKKTKHPISFLATIKQNGNILLANANLTIDRVKWGIHQEKATSITDQFLGGIKDKMIEDEIPIVLRLVFIKK
ncbi:YceI family protein [Pedobacter sp. Du54]|uniref:YceI family protein n=1 Tax=Pedobacter anseongensis TaxID=3133439 RepID=UPI0030A8FC41